MDIKQMLSQVKSLDAAGLAKRITQSLGARRSTLAINIVIILMINLVAGVLYFRCDATRNGAYSLSPLSRELVANLAEPLTVKVFFSKDLPAPYNGVYRYVSDILGEFKNSANRNFRYEFVDVEKQKDAAGDYGIYPVQVREIQSDQVKFRNAFMGIAIVHGDLVEKIESITEAEGIEYRITTLIKKMIGKVDALVKLDGQIAVTFYASSSIPLRGIETVNEQVEKIVRTVGAKNYNKLSYKHVDPGADKNQMALAESYGLFPLRWPAFTTDLGKRVEAGSGVIGVVVEHGGRFETIQVLTRNIMGQIQVNTDTLADGLNAAIGNLISVNQKVGYVTGHNERDINDERAGAANFKTLISDLYEFKTVDLSKDEIPDDINTLIVNGPKSRFSEYELFKIDQFLMKGRSVLFFLDSFDEMNMQGGGGMFGRQPLVIPVDTGLADYLKSFGVSVNRDIVLDMSCYRTANQMFGEQVIYFAPMVNEESLDRVNPITASLKRIFFLKGSSIALQEDALKSTNLTATTLVSSSRRSWLMEGRINFNPMMMQPPAETEMRSHKLAVLVSGQFESYFKDRAEPPVKEEKGKAPAPGGSPIASSGIIKKAVKPGKILVAGTSEITGPSVVDKEGKSPNAILLHNMVDYLAGNTAIPQMRSKGLEFNPLREAGDLKRYLLKGFNIAGVPLLVVAAGLLIWRMRNMRRRRIQQEFTGGGSGE